MSLKNDRQTVLATVDRYLRGQHPGGVHLEVLGNEIEQKEDWWYMPVRPDFEPRKRFEFYEALANVESELEENEHLTVVLLPIPANNGK